MAKLSKFPVIAPDGTEYRVTIRERDDGFWVSYYADVRLYVKRKHFGYRCVYTKDYYDADGVYYVDVPNYVRIASEIIRDYGGFLARCKRERLHEERTARQRSEARKSFTEWDGRIAE